MSKRAVIFLFTDWHLQKANAGRKPEEWPPFCYNQPPDRRPIFDLTAEINQRLGRLLPKNFPPADRVQLDPTRMGLEVIESAAEPKWKEVWGVMIDRRALSAADNADKLSKMAKSLSETLKDRKGRAEVFVTPEGDGNPPPQLAWYLRSFGIYIVGKPDEFTGVAAGLLAAAVQKAEVAVVEHIKDLF
jgi:hypothetical protein